MCTRLDAVFFLWRAAGSPDMEGEFPFADVPFGDGDGHGQPLYRYADQAVLWAVDALAGEPLPVDVAVCFAVQEELGTRGAASGAFMLQPDAALAVDVSFALTPDANPRECGKLGEGPMIGIAPGLDAAYSRRLAALAEAQQIPFQREVMGARTGTDADEISTTAHGVRTVLVSIPQRYMHTPVELVDMRDVENTGRLMAAFVREGVTA